MNNEPQPSIKDIWNTNAAFWDEYVGSEGNYFHRMLVAPATEQLLNIKPGEVVLDIACGNGQFSRRLAELGAQVVAFDFSEVFIERARGHSVAFAEQIEYHVIDASEEEELMSLGERRFDAAVSNMAFMDIQDIEPLISALARLLKPAARFVFSVTHPCFNSVGTSMLAEQQDHDGELKTVYSVKTSSYLQPVARLGLGIVGQPTPHYYFHRPLSVLYKACFNAGFVLDGIEEPAFPSGLDHRRTFSWSRYQDIPPVLISRMNLGQDLH